jgi:ketosteroid isomerase-like protein
VPLRIDEKPTLNNMNRFTLPVLAIILCMVACQKPAPAPVNTEEAKKAVNDLFDAYGKAIVAEDVNAISATLADDGLFIGTDPEEFWTKAQLIEQFTAMAKDTTASLAFTVEKRDIRLSPDGMMAIVTEHSTIPLISNRILVRGVGHANMKDGGWKIDYFSWSLIPKNSDMEKLNKALE